MHTHKPAAALLSADNCNTTVFMGGKGSCQANKEPWISSRIQIAYSFEGSLIHCFLTASSLSYSTNPCDFSEIIGESVACELVIHKFYSLHVEPSSAQFASTNHLLPRPLPSCWLLQSTQFPCRWPPDRTFLHCHMHSAPPIKEECQHPPLLNTLKFLNKWF